MTSLGIGRAPVWTENVRSSLRRPGPGRIRGGHGSRKIRAPYGRTGGRAEDRVKATPFVQWIFNGPNGVGATPRYRPSAHACAGAQPAAWRAASNGARSKMNRL